MNHKQRVARKAALGFYLVSALFPPWSYVLPGWSTQCFAGYRFVFTPPKLRSPDEFRQMFFVYDSPGGSDVVVRIEYIRLVIGWLALLFLSAGTIRVMADISRYQARVAGAIGALIGVALIVCLLLLPRCHAR